LSHGLLGRGVSVLPFGVVVWWPVDVDSEIGIIEDEVRAAALVGEETLGIRGELIAVLVDPGQPPLF
jgi:hypothetical protein